jgi:hypothetical protein
MSALRVNSGTRFNPVIPEPRTRRLHLQVRFRRIRFVALVTRAESGNSLQGWEVDETIEERSGQGQLWVFVLRQGSLAMGRRVFLAVLATIFALIAPADAAGAPDRYCLQGSQSDYPGNCQFNSYFQCMNAASGKGAQCRENPKYEFARKRPALKH